MNKNYFEIKEKKSEIKSYKTILCDLLVLINHCIIYHIDCENFKKAFLEIDKRIVESEKIVKKLESEENV